MSVNVPLAARGAAPHVACVYLIRNTQTGRVYVGSTGDLQHRCAAHRILLQRGEHHNPPLQADWKLYGPQVFVVSVKQEVEDQAQRDALEARLAEQFRASPEGVYNTHILEYRRPQVPDGYLTLTQAAAALGITREKLDRLLWHVGMRFARCFGMSRTRLLSLAQVEQLREALAAGAEAVQPPSIQPDALAALGERLRRAREWEYRTQESLAERAGVSLQMISQLESGSDPEPNPTILCKLARVLWTDEMRLMYGEYAEYVDCTA